MLANKLVRTSLILLSLCMASVAQGSDDEAWVYGKWELSYDPDGGKKDYLEFLPNGDAWSIGPNGKIPGLYIIDGDTVKAVFTWKEKDFIMTFHGDRQNRQLRIVTSRTGKASVYTKIDKP
ncbi:MAG: hypothetical protein GC149_11890 [Gammaproteobacteria bacterium]|nr:hypothetical protein [Gammaproteobacteria bacterium]